MIHFHGVRDLGSRIISGMRFFHGTASAIKWVCSACMMGGVLISLGFGQEKSTGKGEGKLELLLASMEDRQKKLNPVHYIYTETEVESEAWQKAMERREGEFQKKTTKKRVEFSQNGNMARSGITLAMKKEGNDQELKMGWDSAFDGKRAVTIQKGDTRYYISRQYKNMMRAESPTGASGEDSLLVTLKDYLKKPKDESKSQVALIDNYGTKGISRLEVIHSSGWKNYGYFLSDD